MSAGEKVWVGCDLATWEDQQGASLFQMPYALADDGHPLLSVSPFSIDQVSPGRWQLAQEWESTGYYF